MGDHDSPGTCLSAEPHGQPLRDTLLHYFGCLRQDGKPDRKTPLRSKWKAKTLTPAEKDSIANYQRKAFFDTLPIHKQLRIETEMQRITDLRMTFENDADHRSLVEEFKKELGEWLGILRNRVTEQGRASGTLPTSNESEDHAAAEPLRGGRTLSKRNGFGLSANMMLFENNSNEMTETTGYIGIRDNNFPDNFPNQKIPLKDLLYDQNPNSNPLMKPCKEGTIRYFHLPGNNMEWVEEAMARYFNEDRPSYDGLFRQPDEPTKSYMILRPEFWRGQQHGGRHDAVHARHMRPRCDIISTDSKHLEDSPKNLVLFMPYLHWETDRARHKFEETIRKITDKYTEEEKKKGKKFLYMTSSEVKEQNLLLEKNKKTPPCKPNQAKAVKPKSKVGNGSAEYAEFLDPEKPTLRIKTGTEMVQARLWGEKRLHPNSKVSKTSVVQVLAQKKLEPATPLGRVLFAAAQLSEIMECYQEEQLLKTFLHSNPPWHPRRTLDQSYYWTLRSTKRRDRDQVVYRGTAPKKKFMHSEHCKTIKGEPPCKQCWDDIRKVPRVIMVDQLWLWILEGDTIITSFPKRYGRNKPDPSAVHKSLRLRLKVARKNEIRSIYDLALIIIDECSKVFFDRTKTADRQPQMMDIFAEAIGGVNNRTTIAYDHFWDITGQLSKTYKEKIVVDDVEEQAKSLLDVNPEGALSKEIKDILDELHIMLNIKSKQQRVLKDLQKHVEYILAPALAIAKDLGTARQATLTSPKRTLTILGTESAADTSELSQQPDGREPSSSQMDTRAASGNSETQLHDLKAERDAKWTMEFALRLAADLSTRVTDLNHLREAAEQTEKAVDGLLGLKQQQAGVVQAREAVRQAEETLRQGRSIMLFTVITIIFLPLSFGTGLFGMNSIPAQSWTLRKEITYILFPSVIIIVTSLILGFSPFVRSFLSLTLGLFWVWLITATRIYDAKFLLKQDSGSLTRRRVKVSRKLKEKARREYLLRQANKQERQEVELPPPPVGDNAA